MKEIGFLLILLVMASYCICDDSFCSYFNVAKSEYCSNLKAEDDKKRCILRNDKCEEEYKKCEDYNVNVQQSICESIKPIYNTNNIFAYKCVYNNGICEKALRTCDDFSPEEYIENDYVCINLSPTDPLKRCYYNDGNCIETYINCDDYKEDNEETCKSIKFENENKKCVMKEGNCVQEDKNCSEYKKGYTNCRELTSTNPSKICILVNDNCIEYYKNCEDYDGQDEEICASIRPYNDKYYYNEYYTKCVLKENK